LQELLDTEILAELDMQQLWVDVQAQAEAQVELVKTELLVMDLE
jgi:hypothetical protein